MIDDEVTFRYKGYRSTDLSKGSHKEVWRVCAGCGDGRWVEFRHCSDLCNKCACLTDEWRANQRKSHEGKHDGEKNGMYGRSHTPETCTQISKSLQGNVISAETRKKIGDGNRGKVLSDETKRMMSESKVGHEVSEETIEKLRKANIGKKHTDETKLKMSIAGTGRIPSDEARRNMSAAQQGISISEWERFVSYDPYCDKFNKKFKEIVREKFGRKCFICNKTEEENGRKLCVHHVSYDKECMCNGKDCEFVPVCTKCHSMTNGSRYLWEKLIMNVLAYEGLID